MRRVTILCLLAAALGATVSNDDNAFQRAYNAWATFANARVGKPGTVSASEFLAWQMAKHEWRELEKRMDSYYRGEKPYPKEDPK